MAATAAISAQGKDEGNNALRRNSPVLKGCGPKPLAHGGAVPARVARRCDPGASDARRDYARALARLRGRIPASGAAGEVEQGPHRHDGDATRVRTQGAAVRNGRLRGQIPSETLGPLFRPAAAPAPRFGAPSALLPSLPSLQASLRRDA